MSKVIAFLGSPRRGGFTAQLIEQVLQGARSAGAETIVYDLNEEGVKGCQGCFYCRTHEGCQTRDKLAPMYEDIREADGVVAGFPIYFGAISGQGKLWLDRMYPMYGDGFVPRLPGKRAVTVYAQANPDDTRFRSAIDSTDGFLRGIGWELVDSLLVYGDVEPGYTIPKEMLERAFEAGKQLVK
ncbi:MAG: flavodoxin family protein [Clostridiales bacterium]|nr:flavodoxin family protein [Clostridiales bacterium]